MVQMISPSQDKPAPRLIIADDEAKLDGAEGTYFALLGPDDLRRWGKTHRWLPVLPREIRAATLDDYLSCMSQLDGHNYAKPAYWRTALGIRDVEKSILFNGLDQLWRFRALLGKRGADDGDVALLVSDPEFAKLAGEIASQSGWQVSIQLKPLWTRWFARLLGRWQGLRYVLSLAAPMGARRPPIPASADVIIATVSTIDRVQSPAAPRDFIFGQLPDQLAAKGRNVAMFAQLVGETRLSDTA